MVRSANSVIIDANDILLPYVKKTSGAVNVNTTSDGLSLARRARLPSSWRFQQTEDHHFLIW